MKSESVSCSVVSYSLWPHRLLSPWNSPGKNTGVTCHALLQGIFPAQISNPGLLHYRQILYPLSHQGGHFVDIPREVKNSTSARWKPFSPTLMQQLWAQRPTLQSWGCFPLLLSLKIFVFHQDASTFPLHSGIPGSSPLSHTPQDKHFKTIALVILESLNTNPFFLFLIYIYLATSSLSYGTWALSWRCKHLLGCPMACGILVPWREIGFTSLALQGGS